MTEINFYTTKDEYGWMSNFWRANQIVDGIEYRTNENFYQSQKATDSNIALWIAAAPSPYLAMKAGRSLREKEFHPDWEQVKVEVMLKGLRAKFSQNADLREKLLATEDVILHEDSPRDMFWGKEGKDMLGKLLMIVRTELRVDEPFHRWNCIRFRRNNPELCDCGAIE